MSSLCGVNLLGLQAANFSELWEGRALPCCPEQVGGCCSRQQQPHAASARLLPALAVPRVRQAQAQAGLGPSAPIQVV